MKLAIIGTGKIISEALFAMAPVQAIQKNAIFARPHSADKARSFAAQYGIPEVYTDYAALLEQADIDTVYIGLVNSVHYEYAKEALLHNKNVILEKPFVLSSKEAVELQELAAARKLFLLEAITVLHNPVFDKMKHDLPVLGPIRLALCNYSQYSSRYDAYLRGEVAPAFDPSKQGGAVYDLDVYNIHYCVGLFGMPTAVHYYANRGFNEVDTSGALVMEYPDFVCVCTAAKDSDSPCFVSIQGEKGWMKIDGKPNAAKELVTVVVPETAEDDAKKAADSREEDLANGDEKKAQGGHEGGVANGDEKAVPGGHEEGVANGDEKAAPSSSEEGVANGDEKAAQNGNVNAMADKKKALAAADASAPVKDASGAIVRATVSDVYTAPEVHHRMTKEFSDFAAIIDHKDYQAAGQLLEETINVVRVLEMVRGQ